MAPIEVEKRGRTYKVKAGERKVIKMGTGKTGWYLAIVFLKDLKD